jgi:hypothetical protein
MRVRARVPFPPPASAYQVPPATINAIPGALMSHQSCDEAATAQ